MDNFHFTRHHRKMEYNVSDFYTLYFEMHQVLWTPSHKAKFEQYKSERNFTKMFQYLWELNEAHNILKVDLKTYSKDKAFSEVLRKQGNGFYKKKNFKEALDKYNMSIIEAPHPDIRDFPKEGKNDDEAKYKDLAFGYANRSAVLYELKQYKKCIGNIDYAIKYGYPKILLSKLAERKAKCLIGLENYEEAKTLLQTTIASMSDISAADTKSSLENLLASCIGKLTIEDHTSNKIHGGHLLQNLSSLSNNELLFAYENINPPILDDVNPTIPAFSSALGLTYSAYSGRSVVATRDIKPGELLGVEDPYVIMLKYDDPSNVRIFCCFCAARCLTPLPCAYCNKVVFCSDSCRNEGINMFHRVECSIFLTLIQLNMGYSPFLAFRILAKVSFAQLKSIIPKLEEEQQKLRQLQGFNDQGVYDSSDYTTVFHLEGNGDLRTLDNIIEKTCRSFILTKLLINSKCYFIDEFGKPFEPRVSDIILVGSTIIMHLLSITENAIDMDEYQVQVGMNRVDIKDKKHLGSGVYSATSLFNHSCNPSAANIRHGCQISTYSLSFIPKGSEVFVNYFGIEFYEVPGYLRRERLLQLSHFKCNCEACTYNWPTLPFLDTLPKLMNSGGAEGKLMELVQRFQNHFSDTKKQSLDSDKGIAIEVLEFIGRFADMPCSLYVDALKVLIRFLFLKHRVNNFIR